MPTERVLRLREEALNRQVRPPTTTAIYEAEAWDPSDPWIVWRGRRVANILDGLPLEIGPEELLIGRPSFRDPTPEEADRLKQAREVLAQLPPWPGGDTGHFAVDHEKLLRLGIGGLRHEIARYRSQTGDLAKRDFYRACDIALAGVTRFIERHAKLVEAQLASETRAERRLELEQIAAVCRQIAEGSPRTFHEAIQLMHFMIVALWFGEGHVLNVAGRMDRVLFPYYQADLEAGRITPERAQELIDCFYIQINNYCPRGLAVSVMVGGQDAEGRDTTNAVSMMCLQAIENTRLVYPTVGICWHEGTPDDLLQLGCRIIAQGLGSPAVFNDEVISRGLQRYGVAAEDACSYINSTCVEITPIATSNVWVASPYYNCPGALLEVLEDVAAGRAEEPRNFEELVARFRAQLFRHVQQGAANFSRAWEGREQRGGMPLQSSLTHDCIERGLDIDQGGARYNGVECSFVGLANLVDSLIVLKRLVFEERRFSLAEFVRILQRNFEGEEPLRQEILNRFPKYGNDEGEVDDLAIEMTRFFAETCQAQRIAGRYHYVPGLFCWIQHERLGSQTGATPDGRLAGFPLADGAGPAQGRERRGPTGAIKSTTKWSHEPMMGGLVLNLKFSRAALREGDSLEKLKQLILSYMRLGGFEIQINVVDKETLLEAQKHPDAYRDLLVRVAGYSDYFVNLNPNMQAEVIARTEHAEL